MSNPSTSQRNRPGKPSISYRLATHSQFMRSMLERLHLQITHHPSEMLRSKTRVMDDDNDDEAIYPLRSLNALSNEDPTVALLDAWAAAADVLTFYQERLANEGFVRTATERSSVLQLARAVGYEPLPGAAASCNLAFTVEEAEGSPLAVEIPKGIRVESIPDPGKLPISFETVKPLIARAEWNILLPLRTQCQKVGDEVRELMLQGTSTELQPGDNLLFVGTQRQINPEGRDWQLRALDTVVPILEQGKTSVSWSEPLNHLGPAEDLKKSGLQIFVLREKHASLFGSAIPDWRNMPEEGKAGYEEVRGKGNRRDLEVKTVSGKYAIDLDSLYPRLLMHSWIVLIDPNSGPHLCHVSRISTISLSDYSLNARVTRVLTDSKQDLSDIDVRQTIVLAQSEPLILAEAKRTMPPEKTEIELDRLVHGLARNKALIIRGKRMRARILKEDLKFYPENTNRSLLPGDVLLVTSAPTCSCSGQYPPENPQTSKCTIMDAEGYIGQLEYQPGDIQFQSALEKDEFVSEDVLLLSTSRSSERTTLILENAPSNFYDPQTMEILANVVLATHGETVKEVLGSGDGTRVNQSFALKKQPLTFTSEQNSRGGMSTLEVRVDDVLWDEASSLNDLVDSSREYILRIDERGTARIIFGDGKKGARLPTGQENIVATYRCGLGPEGNVRAGCLSLLQSRPPGIRSVTNPAAASGAAAPESIFLAKRNAPRTLMTLGRLVSLLDYESFAKSFVGIGKAKATEILMEQGKKIHITVSAQDGSRIDSNSEIFKNLQRAIENRRRPVDRVEICSYRLLTFKIEASLAIDRHFDAEEVKRQSVMALRDTFSFSRRSYGQDVTASEIIACLQKVDGVVYARLDSLQLDPYKKDNDMKMIAVEEMVKMKSLTERFTPISQHMEMALMSPARFGSGRCLQILKASGACKGKGKREIEPAEMLLINPAPFGITLKIWDKELSA